MQRTDEERKRKVGIVGRKEEDKKRKENGKKGEAIEKKEELIGGRTD